MLLGCAPQVRIYIYIYIPEGERASGESGAERWSWAHYASDSTHITDGSQKRIKTLGEAARCCCSAAHALSACYWVSTEWISQFRIAESPTQTASFGSGFGQALIANMNQTATVSQVKCQSSKTIKVRPVSSPSLCLRMTAFLVVAAVFMWWRDEV